MISNKNKLFNSKIVISACALSLCALMSACSSQSDDAIGQNDGDSQGEQTIELWDYLGQGVSDEAIVAAIDEFENKYPNIKVDRKSFAYSDLSQSIVQGGVGGSVPDVAIVDVVDNQNFATLGLLKDITSISDVSAEDFFEGPWSSTQVDGKTFGIPLNSNNLALYYNKDIFEENSIEVPTNWDELRDVANQLSNEDRQGLAISAIKNEQSTFQFLPFVWQTGGDLDSFATSGAEALSFLKGLIDNGSMSSSVTNFSQEDARTQFVNGKAAMMINGPWELNNLKDSDVNYAVAKLPEGEEAATSLGGENVVIFEDTESPDAAIEFAQFLTSNEGAKIYCDISGQLPGRRDLQGELKLSDDADMQVFESQLQDAHARAYGANYNEISAAIQETIQKVLTGAQDPAAAAEETAEEIKPLLPNK